MCVCVCVMKKCKDEIAGLDTTVVLQGNKPFSLELSITLDRKYDPCEWDSVGQVWNLFSCEVFVGIGYKCKANYHPLTTCCHAIVWGSENSSQIWLSMCILCYTINLFNYILVRWEQIFIEPMQITVAMESKDVQSKYCFMNFEDQWKSDTIYKCFSSVNKVIVC